MLIYKIINSHDVIIKSSTVTELHKTYDYTQEITQKLPHHHVLYLKTHCCIFYAYSRLEQKVNIPHSTHHPNKKNSAMKQCFF